MRLDINNNEVVRFTAKLEQIRKSALPSAVRGTLNNAAFDLKKDSMPKQAGKDFVNRSPNFFKANSTVVPATGWEVNSMKATVGFIESRLRLGSDRNLSVKDLEQQEHSGRLPRKEFIPLDTARVSGYNSLVKPANRLSKIFKAKIVIARNLKGKTKKQQFVRAVQKAQIGGYVIGSNVTGENILWRVDTLISYSDIASHHHHLKFTLTPLYSFRKGRKVSVKGKGFMHTASLASANKMNDFYIRQATFYFSKYSK